MFGRFDRSRRRGDTEVTSNAATAGVGRASDEHAGDASAAPGDAAADALPEQPVPLPPIPSPRRAKVGVVLPARRSLLPSLPVPRVPKRAIFAVGICAGLAAPSLTRHLANRAVTAALGSGLQPATTAAWESATVEIIRVTFGSQERGGTAAAVGRLLEQLRR